MMSISSIVAWASEIINPGPGPGRSATTGGTSGNGGGVSTGYVTYDVMFGGAVYSGSGWETANRGSNRMNSEVGIGYGTGAGVYSNSVGGGSGYQQIQVSKPEVITPPGATVSKNIAPVTESLPESIPMKKDLLNFIYQAAMKTPVGRFLYAEIARLQIVTGHTVEWRENKDPYSRVSMMHPLNLMGSFEYGVGSSVQAIFTRAVMTYEEAIFHVVHELSHIYNQLLGTVWAGRVVVPKGTINWSEVQAMDWENTARVQMKQPPATTYPPGGGLLLPNNRPWRREWRPNSPTPEY
jgi:hypothetical protein